MKHTGILTATLLCVLSQNCLAKPLKVFILAGQSNMEGHASVRTFDYIGKDPATAPILKEMRNPDGTPRVCDQVWMSYLTGPYDGSANGEGLGKLTAGFGERGDNPTKMGGKIGPEFTFGIYMEKGLNEPILIIKTAWGGRSLNTEFRPPSAGPYKLPKVIQDEWDKHPQGAHGIPKLEDRKAWQEKKDKLKEYEDRRFRDITLPAGMKDWQSPDFDDSQWSVGKAPIGKGVWKHSGITLERFPSTWGEGEFLLMRTTFEVEDLDCESYRIAVLARQGFHVYLNGKRIHTYIWWQDKPQYGAIVLEDNDVKHLRKGKNVLAVYSNDQYDLRSPEHYAATDVWIEGITKVEREKLDLALEEVLSPKDREALKGASNGGYHYFGSAKIFAQMGKAFAEALLRLRN